jgi:hypothetical protein
MMQNPPVVSDAARTTNSAPLSRRRSPSAAASANEGSPGVPYPSGIGSPAVG